VIRPARLNISAPITPPTKPPIGQPMSIPITKPMELEHVTGMGLALPLGTERTTGDALE